MEENQQLVRAEGVPCCLRHGVMESYSYVPARSRGARDRDINWEVRFRCTDCRATARADRPYCDKCSIPMLLVIKTGKFSWNCANSCQTKPLELCGDCGGFGWLHMDNRSYGARNERVLGHPFGMHIERCDCCGHMRFTDDIEAELAHREECECGHGIPSNGASYTWIDYPGSRGELHKAFTIAGFLCTWHHNGELEVYIPDSEADIFINVLDATYENMKTNPDTSLTDDRWRSAHENLSKAAYNLLAQLNEMNFQDHRIVDQRRLESRRRALLETLATVEQLKTRPTYTGILDDNTSRGRDRQAAVVQSLLPTAGGYRIEDLQKLEDENVLMGRIYLDGEYCHIQLVEVQTINGEQQPVNDPHRRYYDGVGQFNDEAMATVRVDGFPGSYVMFIFPAAQ